MTIENLTIENLYKENVPFWNDSDIVKDAENKIDTTKLPMGEVIVVEYHNFLFIDRKLVDKQIYIENVYSKTGKEKKEEILITEEYERKLGKSTSKETFAITVTLCERKHSYFCKEYPNATIIARKIENGWVIK